MMLDGVPERQDLRPRGAVGLLDGRHDIVSELDRCPLGNATGQFNAVAVSNKVDHLTFDLNVEAIKPHTFSRHSAPVIVHLGLGVIPRGNAAQANGSANSFLTGRKFPNIATKQRSLAPNCGNGSARVSIPIRAHGANCSDSGVVCTGAAE